MQYFLSIGLKHVLDCQKFPVYNIAKKQTLFQLWLSLNYKGVLVLTVGFTSLVAHH